MVVFKKTLSLSEGWKYKASDDASDSQNWHNAQPVPTSIHLDLLANGVIPDPFPEKNKELVQWVSTKTWIYEKKFTVTSRLCENLDQKVVLVFEGLDTYTTVTLDDETILVTNNMFVSHQVDITEQIHSTQSAADQTHTL
jgi:beta-mannosidase